MMKFDQFSFQVPTEPGYSKENFLGLGELLAEAEKLAYQSRRRSSPKLASFFHIVNDLHVLEGL